MKTNFIEKIKSHGYWRINFQPIVATIKLKDFKSCRELIEKNSVKLRGWDFPHIPRRQGENGGSGVTDNCYEAWEEFGVHKEFWQIFKSGQFLCYRALGEDWFSEDSWYKDLSERIKPDTSLGVIGSVIYQITEVLEFLSRLTHDGIYNEGVKVNIALQNTKGRILWIDSSDRAPFFYERKTQANEIKFSKIYNKNEVIENPKKLAREIILEVFDYFEWEPTEEQITRDQENLYSGR